MPKALFFNVPASGHVNPSLPLVAALVRRAHHITYFSTEHYRPRIEAVGAVFRPYTTIQDNYFDVHRLDGGKPQKVAYHLISTTKEILPELLAAAQQTQPDYILFDGMCPWGYFVARILGLPAVASLALMPLTSLPPSAMLNRQMLQIILPMMLRDFNKGIAANMRSQSLGKKYGVPPLGPTEILNATGDISLSYTSAYFQPFADTVSNTIRFVGWTVHESSTDETLPLQQIQDRHLIYISLGTMNNDNAAFFRTCIEAFTGSDDCVVISTGNRINPALFGVLPENIVVQSWVPQIAILKRAALFITHAGMSSVHDGLYFGVPLLLVPQQGEQTITALRVVELGAGLMLTSDQVNAAMIRATAAQLIADTRFKVEASRIADTFRSAGGVERAAEEIEALLGRRTGSKP